MVGDVVEPIGVLAYGLGFYLAAVSIVALILMAAYAAYYLFIRKG